MRRRVRAVAAVAAVVGMLALPTFAPQRTLATWVDAEHVHARALGGASADCDVAGLYATVGHGRLLTGTVAGRSLDAVVAVDGVRVQNAGSGATAAGGSAVGPDAYASTVVVDALDGAVRAELGVPLPITWADGSTGLWTQFGLASSTGTSTGASGTVTNAGGIAPGVDVAPSGAVDLSGALDAAGLPQPSGLRDLALRFGPLAATATLDECALRWGGPGALDRDYRVGALELAVRAAAIERLGDATADADDALRTALTGLTGSGSALSPAEQAVADAAAGGLTDAVAGAVAGLPLVQPSVSASASVAVRVDPATLTALDTVLRQTLRDPTGTVEVDFATGEVRVDVAKVTALDGRDPNTRVLTPSHLATVAERLTDVLLEHAARVDAAWVAVQAGTTVTVTATATVRARVGLLAADVARVQVGSSGTLADYAAGVEHRPAPTVTALSPVLDAGALIAALTPALLADAVHGPVRQAVGDRVTSPVGSAVGVASRALDGATGHAAADAARDLDDLADVLRVTVNRQENEDDTAGADPGEVWDVTALHVAVGDGSAAGSDAVLSLSLAGASVGRNTTLAGR